MQELWYWVPKWIPNCLGGWSLAIHAPCLISVFLSSSCPLAIQTSIATPLHSMWAGSKSARSFWNIYLVCACVFGGYILDPWITNYNCATSIQMHTTKSSLLHCHIVLFGGLYHAHLGLKSPHFNWVYNILIYTPFPMPASNCYMTFRGCCDFLQENTF